MPGDRRVQTRKGCLPERARVKVAAVELAICGAREAVRPNTLPIIMIVAAAIRDGPFTFPPEGLAARLI